MTHYESFSSRIGKEILKSQVKSKIKGKLNALSSVSIVLNRAVVNIDLIFDHQCGQFLEQMEV